MKQISCYWKGMSYIGITCALINITLMVTMWGIFEKNPLIVITIFNVFGAVFLLYSILYAIYNLIARKPKESNQKI